MKYLILTFLLFGLHSVLFSVECRKYINPYVGPDERGEPFILENKHTSYVITFRYTNPTPTQVPEVLIGMPEPVNLTGFSRRDFVRFQVNGIDSSRLEPKKYEIFNRQNEAGVDIYYNFNGIMMILRLAVSEFSPLLLLQLQRDASVPADAVKSLQVSFNVLPCASSKKRNSYAREIISPCNSYRGAPGIPRQKRTLSPKDTCLILQDAQYQANDAPDNSAPVFLVPNWENIIAGNAIFGTHQNMDLIFRLDTKAPSWSFEIFDSEKKRTNKEFLDFLSNTLMIF